MSTEVPLFFGDGLFGVLHSPSGEGVPGWVLCSPFGSERINSQRFHFEWARCLAAAGHWSLRFDYRGTGDSSGVFEQFCVDDYLADIDEAVAELERLSGMPCRGLMGLRFGAALAAISLARIDRALDLVMWEPVLDGRSYRNSLLRTAMANELVNSSGAHRSREDFRRELAAGNQVMVDGFALEAPMYDSLAQVDLAALGRPTRERVLIVQMGRRGDRPPKPALTELAASYSGAGDVRLDSVRTPPVWLKTKSFVWRLDHLFKQTLDWIAEEESGLLERRPPGRPAAGEIERQSSVERAVGFSVEGKRVWGILHQPGRPSGCLPCIVMIAAGEACRAAFFYKRLARDLADRGWTVLRFDPRGIGDSHGDLGCTLLDEVFARIQGGGLVEDARAAIDYVERECGAASSVLIGLCGGAMTSVFAARMDRRIVGMAPLDFTLRLTPVPKGPAKPDLSGQLPWHERFSQSRGTLYLLLVRRLYHRIKDNVRRFTLALGRTAAFRSPRALGGEDWLRERIGEDANLDLLEALRKTVDLEIPICCVFADIEDARLFTTAVESFCAGRPQADSLINVHVIEGADHNFLMPGNTEDLIAELHRWLGESSRPWASALSLDEKASDRR